MLLKWLKQPQRKLFVLSSLALLLLLPSVITLAQEAKYSVKFEQGNLEEALRTLRKTTSTIIAFNKEEIKDVAVKPVEYNNKTIEQILTALVANTSCIIEKRGTAWLVKKDTDKQAAPAQQKDPGSITGKIIDEENGSPIAGATVRIGNKGATTDKQGIFRISLPAGSYTATISHIGYGTKEVSEIEIKENRTSTVNITLKRDRRQLATVTVRTSARKESIAALYARQRNNAAISDGISAEQIRATPDNNAAQVLKRISGLTVQDDKFVTVRGLSDRYNNVMLNGANLPSSEPNRRNFSFDVIPSGLIDNIVVNKTATPDMPSEFAGGLVQVNTKDIPSENIASLTLGTGINTNTIGNPMYSSKRNGGDYLGLYNNDRNWWNRTWSTQEYRKLIQEGENKKIAEMGRRIPNNWGLYKYKYSPVQNYQFVLGRKFDLKKNNTALGFTLAGTYRHDESTTNEVRYRPSYYYYDSAHTYDLNTSLGFVANIGFQTTGHKIVLKNLYNRRFSNETNVFNGKEFATYSGPVRYYVDTRLINSVLQNRLEGEHLLHKHLKFDWAFDLINLRRDQPDTRASNGFQMDGPKGYYQYVLGDNNGFMTEGLNIFNSALKETKKNANANFTIPLTVGGKAQTIKVGYAGTFRTADFQSLPMRTFINVGASSGAVLDATFGLSDYQIHAPEFIAPGMLYYKPSGVGVQGFSGDDYTGEQQLHAAYAMVDLKLMKSLRFIGGVRMENNNMTVNGVTFAGGQRYDTTRKYSSIDWLPSANLVYNLTANMNIRASYSRTMARADFRERSPFMYFEFKERDVYKGAIGLKDAKITNWDLRYEYYPGPGEIIAISAFYKQFDSPVELVAAQGSPGLVYFYFNLRNSINKGFELDLRKSLGFINPEVSWLKRFFVSANATWMKANVSYNSSQLLEYSNGVTSGGLDALPPDSRNRPLQGLSPYVINGGLGYFGDRFGVNTTYNRYGRRIVNAGVYMPQDQYENPRDVIDLQFSFMPIKDKLQIRFNISDLLQQDYVIYQNAKVTGGPNSGGGGGLENLIPNGDPKGDAYNKDIDYTRNRLFKGRNLSLNLTYNF